MFAIVFKIVGGLCIVFGFSMIVLFPCIGEHQRSPFTWTGILIGIASLLLGIYLIRL